MQQLYEIVWSWHFWMTGYVLQGTTSFVTYAQVQQLTQNRSVHQYATDVFKDGGAYTGKVIMDRNLCAAVGGFPSENTSLLEFTKQIGCLYYWGRKDSFLGSIDGTANKLNITYDGEGREIKLGKTIYSNITLVNSSALQYVIEHSEYIIAGSRNDQDNSKCSWCNSDEATTEYQCLYNNSKALYDPYPAGWKTPYQTVYRGWNTGQGYWSNANGAFMQNGNAHERGERLHNASGGGGVPPPRTEDNIVWFPVAAYRPFANGNLISDGSAAGYEGTSTIAKNGNNHRVYYTKIAAGELSTLANARGIIGKLYPF